MNPARKRRVCVELPARMLADLDAIARTPDRYGRRMSRSAAIADAIVDWISERAAAVEAEPEREE